MDNKIYDFLHPDARFIRKMVFMKEQGFENEFDDIDDQAKHVVIYSQLQPVATCRIYKTADGTYHIGRICVLMEYRGAHLGSKLLKLAEEEIKKEADTAYLDAQVRAIGFYEANGYAPFGDEFDDEGVPHIHMKKTL